jgi:hypothetical protein
MAGKLKCAAHYSHALDQSIPNEGQLDGAAS